MTERDALLAGIRANPADDTVRLVYADWLDENGETEYAEFIRVQVELAKRLTPGDLSPGCSCKRSRCRVCETVNPLRRRELELWLGGHIRARMQAECRWASALDLVPVDRPGIPGVFALVRRGFVAEVRVARLADWIGGECNHDGGRAWLGGSAICPDCRGTGRTPGIGPAVVAVHPVTLVTAVDREPAGVSGYFYWTRVDPPTQTHHLPQRVFNRLPDYVKPVSLPGIYATREDAFSALSFALIAAAKHPEE